MRPISPSEVYSALRAYADYSIYDLVLRVMELEENLTEVTEERDDNQREIERLSAEL